MELDKGYVEKFSFEYFKDQISSRQRFDFRKVFISLL